MRTFCKAFSSREPPAPATPLMRNVVPHLWSSHLAYLGRIKVSWLTMHRALRLLGTGSAARTAYRRRLRAGATTEGSPLQRLETSEVNAPPKGVVVRSFESALSAEVKSRLVEQAIDAACAALDVSRDKVLSSSRVRRLGNGTSTGYLAG